MAMTTRAALGLAAAGLLLGGCGVGSSNGIDAAPIVAITAPVDGATVGNNVNIAAEVFDDFGVDKVEFLIDGTLLATQFDPPFSVNWNTQTVTNNANHTIRVQATDTSGQVAFKQIVVLVQRGTQ